MMTVKRLSESSKDTQIRVDLLDLVKKKFMPISQAAERRQIEQALRVTQKVGRKV